MTFKDYVVGRRVELVSQLDREAVELAIGNRIKSAFNPFYTGVVGWCRFGRVRLRWATAMWGNGFQPTFRGKLFSGPGCTRLEGRFGAPPILLIFFGFWYVTLASMLITTLGAYVNGSLASLDILPTLAAIILFLFVPVGFHLLANRSADRHFESILAALNEHAGFENAVDA